MAPSAMFKFEPALSTSKDPSEPAPVVPAFVRHVRPDRRAAADCGPAIGAESPGRVAQIDERSFVAGCESVGRGVPRLCGCGGSGLDSIGAPHLGTDHDTPPVSRRRLPGLGRVIRTHKPYAD